MTIRNFIFTVFLTLPLSVFSQLSPGGVGTVNLTAWFRADDLAAGNVMNWTTQYPNGAGAVTVEDPQTPFPQLQVNPVNSISNYNRTIQFDGNSYVGQNIALVQGLRNLNPPELLKNAYSGDEGSYFCSYYLPTPPSANGHLTLYNANSDAIQCRNLNGTGRIALGQLPINSLNATRDWVEDNAPNIISYTGNRSSTNSMKGYSKGSLIPTGSVPSQSSSSDGLYFGYSPTIQSSAYNGFLHEIIFFNRDLTQVELAQVHTYLAVKYGVTLDNQLGGIYGDYVSTDGNTIWDADADPGFHNDVIGIGRDDIEGLLQKQSHSFDDSIRLYINNLEAANEDNIGIINSDISYIMAGHNAAPMCGTGSSNQEMPAGVTSRIAREIRISNTNFDQDFNLDLKLDTCSSIAGIELTKIRLLVDTNDDFLNANVLSQADGLTFSVSNGIVSIEGISTTLIPVNSTRYVTLAYVDTDYSFSATNLDICENEEGFVVLDITAGATITINYSDGTNSYEAVNVEDGDTIFLPQQSATFDFEPLSGLINCCNGQVQLTATQNVFPLPILSIDATNDSLCFGEELTLTASGANTYNWDQGVQNGDSFVPTQTQNYQVIGTTVNGCISSLDTVIEIMPLPNVNINNPITEACANDTITYTATGADEYVWNQGIQNAIPFMQSPGTFTYEVIGFTNFGCTDTATVDLDVFEIPTIDVMGETEICRGVDLSLEAVSNQNVTFNWTGDGAIYLSNQSNSNVDFNSINAGTYTLISTAENNNGCLNSDTLEVNVDVCEPPTAIISATTLEICPDELITLFDASLGDSIHTWDWQMNGATPSTANGAGPHDIQYTNPGTYPVVLEVTNYEGSDSDTIWIVVNPCLPPTTSFTTDLPYVCEGECVVINNTSDDGSANTNYSIYINNQLVHASNVAEAYQHCFDDNGTYEIMLVGENIYGSDTTISNYLVRGLPYIDLTAYQEISYEDTAELIVYNDDVSVWWESDFVDCNNCNTTYTSPASTTSYIVEVTDEFGCVASAEAIVHINYDDFVEIPDNFSPNGDGINDVLYVEGFGVKSLELKIYNRYGQLVFYSDNQSEGWNGEVNGKMSNSASFVYILKYTLVNDFNRIKEGTINLIR